MPTAHSHQTGLLPGSSPPHTSPPSCHQLAFVWFYICLYKKNCNTNKVSEHTFLSGAMRMSTIQTGWALHCPCSGCLAPRPRPLNDSGFGVSVHTAKCPKTPLTTALSSRKHEHLHCGRERQIQVPWAPAPEGLPGQRSVVESINTVSGVS